ncbi:unnamed protein product [Arctia plantaginis]|uniref:Uncharacterized protein n=1 Tax=Arctia plantaginis TaxID=874455 RepID=A0A8S1AWX0_ARCPL|nr:unnamed protein product [Arctia plantaginis]
MAYARLNLSRRATFGREPNLRSLTIVLCSDTPIYKNASKLDPVGVRSTGCGGAGCSRSPLNLAPRGAPVVLHARMQGRLRRRHLRSPR